MSYSYEYAADIYNALFGGNEMFEFYGNVRNFGLIDNLPEGSCVEVPMIASKAGMRPLRVGPLPGQIALLLNNNARCEDLAVEGLIDGDRRKIYHAVLFDPLTSAVLSPGEAKSMVDEMLEANREYLPESLY